MFGQRCTLCGGKLDSRKICTECGLDNSRSEKYYKVNQSSCDGEPLTHVHEEAREKKEKSKNDGYHRNRGQYTFEEIKQKTAKKQKAGKKQTTINRQETEKKSGLIKKAVTVCIVLSVLGTIIESLSEMGLSETKFGDLFDEINLGGGSDYERSYPYEWLEKEGEELPQDGEEAEFTLVSGKYIVGVHIPAGCYEAETQNEYDVVQVDDSQHSIYLYERTGSEDENYLDDLRLFDGAVVTISAEEPVKFLTENAQEVEYEDNPLTLDYLLAGSTEAKTAGVDFEPGVYDLEALQGAGGVTVKIYDTEGSGEVVRNYSLYLGEDNADGKYYKNLILPERSTIETEDYRAGDDETGEEFGLSMTPSQSIASTDYLEMYMDYENNYQ